MFNFPRTRDISFQFCYFLLLKRILTVFNGGETSSLNVFTLEFRSHISFCYIVSSDYRFTIVNGVLSFSRSAFFIKTAFYKNSPLLPTSGLPSQLERIITRGLCIMPRRPKFLGLLPSPHQQSYQQIFY